jgi:phosphoketolase
MKSYRPSELFDDGGRLRPELAELPPRGARRMSANPHTNGGLLLSDLRLPDFRDYAIKVPAPGAAIAESTREMGRFLRDVMKRNSLCSSRVAIRAVRQRRWAGLGSNNRVDTVTVESILNAGCRSSPTSII